MTGNPLLKAKRFAVAAPTEQTATIHGVVAKTSLFLLLFALPFTYLSATEASVSLGVIGGALGVALLSGLATVYRPQWAAFTGSLYALCQGLAVAAVCQFVDQIIVTQAVLITAGIFALMLGLYVTRLIRVTETLRSIIVTSTLAVIGWYLIGFVGTMMGLDVALFHDGGLWGMGINLVILGIASVNLLLDFEHIEAIQGQAPARAEWYAAFGLTVTLIWVFLEVLEVLTTSEE
ncbi:MAG: Bax inhibitor-1/YccA family protein [Bacteroidota bacterium]